MYYFLPKAANRPVFSLPAFDHSLLGADLHLHLGRAASPALHRAAGLGAIARHGVLGDAGGAVLGRHVERPAHAARRVGQGAAGPDAEVHGRGGHRLRHGHARRPDARHQERQRALALHRLDHRPRPHRRAGLERLPHLQRALLAVPAALQHEALVHQAGQLPFLDRAARHDVLRGADVRQRRDRRA